MNMRLPHKALVSCFICLAAILSAPAAWKLGDSLPDLRGQQLEGTLPDSLKGKVVLLDFWASWCMPCAESFPVLEEFHKQYQDQGLVILGINTDEKRGDMEKFLKKHPVSFTILRDAAQRLVAQADATTMPTSFLVGRDGKVRFMHAGYHGQASKKEYISEIESLLKEKP
ncbi:MAG: Redoxin domain protein [Verrucomicrobiales bacterium]|nr:Redoxin domain protein [Verrucomicrobiales bacterium]